MAIDTIHIAGDLAIATLLAIYIRLYPLERAMSSERGAAVRMTELSHETGVPIPTIKYYLREGLLEPGERTSPNQAQYQQSHVRRLKLIRALIDVGGLSVAAARMVLTKMDSFDSNVLHVLGKAQYSTVGIRDHIADEVQQEATELVDQLMTERGWDVGANNPARQWLGEVLATLDRLGQRQHFDLLANYAQAAENLAAAEVDMIDQLSDVDSMAETVILWTLLGDALLGAMRRLAQENAAKSRFTAVETG